MNTRTIPTYGPDGRRTRDFTLAAIERLAALSLIVTRRNRKGVVTRAHFRMPDGANPLLATCHMGQKYSIMDGAGPLRWWQFTDFLTREDRAWLSEHEQQDVELYLQSIFRAVPLSCIAKNEKPLPSAPPTVTATPRHAKVVSIDTYRKQRRQDRPIEFDSERRATVVSIDSRRRFRIPEKRAA